MSPMLPEPDPAGLPAPLALLRVLLLLTFTLHLLPMNLLLGGGLVAGWAALRGQAYARARRPEDAARMQAIAGGLGALLPAATAFAVTFGVAPLLFVQVIYGPLFYTSSVLMAWPWLAVIPVIMLGYYGHHALAARHGALDRASVWLGFGSAAAFLLTALVFVMNMTLMLRPGRFHGLYAASPLGLHLHLEEPTLWPRFLHFVVGSLALTGVTVAFLGAARRRRDPAQGLLVRETGVRLFTVATLVQVVVGAWVLSTLPVPVRAAFLGARAAHTSLLLASVFMAVLSLIVMPRSLAGGSALVMLTVVGMVVVRQRVRALMLEPDFVAGMVPVHPQWTAFAVFAGCLVGAIAVVTWMVVCLARARPPEGSV